jgi:hypothetical protein
MKYIYVLEDELKFQEQIYKALKVSEPDAKIRFFVSIEEFQKWIVQAVKLGNQSLYFGGSALASDPEQELVAQPDDHLLLLISKEEWLGSRHMALIRKTQDMLLRKKICTVEDPTRLVLSAFENPDFDIKLVEDRVICNVIFKPFDELILQQMLHFALKGHHPASESFVHSVTGEYQVEMTKEVQMEAVSDMGFVTRSPRPIEVGKISKYYGEVFRGKGRIHVMARCLSCQPHPEFKNEFQICFSYLGIPSHQISDIRKSMIKRNEVEYSGDPVHRPTGNKEKWILIESDTNRVQKWKDILNNNFNATCETVTNFETFLFQMDPAASQKSQKEKAWTDGASLTLTLNVQAQTVLLADPNSNQSKKIFGLTFEELQKKSFLQLLHPQSQTVWSGLIKSVSPKPEVLLVSSQNQFFLVKVMTEPYQKDQKEKKFEFTEPSESEKQVWFDQNFPNPMKSFCLVISSQYVTEERVAFWRELFKVQADKGFKPRVVLLFDQVPSEKLSRELDWVDDIYEDSNEKPYIERKLKWLYFGDSQKEAGTPFLNACKELIRVANPVDVAELSEAGLIINYYRQISLGAFRYFVLPTKQQDSFSEFLANCNYSQPHPSEKDLFQVHFVFFGVTDLLLKQIRVWILENYVNEKQKEN